MNTEPSIVDFAEHRVLNDQHTRQPTLVRVAGRFSGVGIDAAKRRIAEEWLGEASFAALQRFTRPLTELIQHKDYWGAETTRLIQPVFFQQLQAQGTVQIHSVEVKPAPRISEQPPMVFEPWSLELGEIIDAPTATPVRPVIVVECEATPIAPEFVSVAQQLATDASRTVVSAECTGQKSILDLLMIPSLLNDAVNTHFSPALERRAFSRGKIRVQDLRLNEEDSARLRDLYAQIAAARGAG